MRRSLIPAALSALVVLSLLASQSGAAERGKVAARAAYEPQKIDPRQPRGKFVPGEVLVKFRAGVARGVERAVHTAVGSRVLSRIGGSLGIDHVRLGRGLTVAAAVQRYAANPLVEYAEPNYYRFPTPFTPNDPSYASLWGLDNTNQAHPVADPPPATAQGTTDADMDVAEAWDTEKGDPNVIVAVLDSGVDTGHADLRANLWTNPGEIPGNMIDDDFNGKADDMFGWDFAQNDNTLLDPATIAGYEHGTHVAGTIAAVTQNGTGISGVCGGDGTANSGCKIMVLKFMEPIDTDFDTIPDTMAGETAAELQAITYARQMGADVINASYGGPSWLNSERTAIQQAGSASDVLFVAAAANDSLDNDVLSAFDVNMDGFFDIFAPAYPASYNLPTVLSVAASNHHDEYGYATGCEASPLFEKWECGFTNWGRYSVDVAAPGVDILSTVPLASGSYATFDGTSMATPHVAGVAGRVQARDLALNGGMDTLTAVEIKNMIMSSVDTADQFGTPLDLNNSMATPLMGAEVTGKFTRTSGRVNGLDALSGSTANASPNHDGDIPGAAGMSRSKVTGSLAWPGDVSDVRKKKLARGKTYRITLIVPSGRDYDLFLYKATTKEIWQPSGVIRVSARGGAADETFTYKPGSTKTFFIQTTTWFSNGSYTLKVVCIANC